MKSDPESGDQVTKFSHAGFLMEFLCKEKRTFGLYIGPLDFFWVWFTLMDFLGV